MSTVVQRIEEAIKTVRAFQSGAVKGEAKREYALAITALEDAQMRFTRGRSIETDVFAPADLEKTLEGKLEVELDGLSIGGQSLNALVAELEGQGVRVTISRAS